MENDVLTRIQQGEREFQNGKTEAALAIFDSVLDKDPHNLFALNNKGVALNRLNQFEQAIHVFQQLLEKNAADPTVIFNLISNYLHIGRWDKAEDVFEQYRHTLALEDAEKIAQDLQILRSSRNLTGSTMIDPLLYKQFQERINSVFSKNLFFIMGVPKSGTTWTQYLLDGHPQLWCSGEGDLNMLLGLFRHMIEEYNNHVVSKNKHIGTTNYTLFQKEDLHYLIITAFALLMSNGDVYSKVNCIGMKYPALTKSAHIFGRLFSKAKFIHVIREGRDVLVSAWFNYLRRDEEATRKRWPTFKHFIDYGVKEWVAEVKKVRSFGRSFPDRYFELYYEKLHEDPDPIIKELLLFLGVDASTAMIERCREAGSFTRLSAGRKRGHENRNTFFRKGITGDWKNHFDQDHLDLFLEHGGEMMKELGYEI